MVPPNWEHPKKEKYNYITGQSEMRYQPMHDHSYTQSMDEWIEGYLQWKKGEHPDQLSGLASGHEKYADWAGNPPDADDYHPEWKDEERIWFQVYETVSEGTPVTPPFATREELVEYLVANGDYWDQQRRKEGNSFMNCEPWSREAATKFVFGAGWAPTAIISNGEMMTGVEYLGE